jgi:hypothetical protein
LRVGTRSTRSVRSTLGLAAALAMVMALLPGTAFAQTTAPDARGTDAVCDGEYDSDFDDIAGSAHEGNIRCMADFGLTEGLRGGTSYGPRLDVNRGQMASFIARFIEDYTDEDLPEGDDDRFGDVDPSYVHADNINALAEIGVVEGTNASGGQSYAPNLGVSRAQMASFIRRALSYLDDGQVNPPSAPPIATADYFADDAGSIHEANINSIAGVGIVQGFQDGTYRPNEIVKRDQMASFVMRAYDYAVSEDLGADPADPEPSVTITAEDTTVAPGEDVTVTFEGDVDQVDSVTVSGDCIATDDTPVTIGEDDTASITIDEGAADGDCVLTFTVAFDDEDGTVQSVDVTVTVQSPVAPSVTVSTEAESVAPGEDLEVAFAGDIDQVDTVTVTGDCIARMGGGEGERTQDVTVGEDGSATVRISENAEDGDCVLTFTVTFDDESTQDVELTVPVATPTFAPTVLASEEEVCVGEEVTITLDNTGSTETAHYTGDLILPNGDRMPLNYVVDGGETHTITDTLGSEGTYRVEWLATADGHDDAAGQFEIVAANCPA